MVITKNTIGELDESAVAGLMEALQQHKPKATVDADDDSDDSHGQL